MEEVERCGDGQLECEHFEDEILHSQHLLLRVRIVRDVNKFGHLGRVDFLVFTTRVNQVLNKVYRIE